MVSPQVAQKLRMMEMMMSGRRRTTLTVSGVFAGNHTITGKEEITSRGKGRENRCSGR